MNKPTVIRWLRSLAVLIAAFFATLSVVAGETAILLDGKLTIEIAEGWKPDKDKAVRQSIANYRAKKSDAWGAVLRGTNGLDPAGLDAYKAKKIADYTKGLSWLPKLTWLKTDVTTIAGRSWADLCFIGQLEGTKNPRDGMMYTRIFSTSYEGQLLEIMFTSNTDKNPTTKAKIDRMIDSVRLVD
jgi:hypothetical protein